MRITITVQGADQVQARMRRLGQDLYDFSAELRSTGQYLADYFSRVPFGTLGRNYGSQWPDVTPGRAAYKQKYYPQNAHNALQASGLMRNSFAYESSRLSLAVRNTQPYFRYHQLGEGRNPLRVMMAIDATNKAEVIRIITEGVQARINASR